MNDKIDTTTPDTATPTATTPATVLAAAATPDTATPTATTPATVPAAAATPDTSTASTPATPSTTSIATTAATTAPATTAAPALAATSFAPITQDEIAAFADKLEASGAALTPAERALLEVVAQQARAVTPNDVRALELRQGIAAALQSVVAAQAQAWGGDPPDEGWVKIDPVWYKSGGTDAGATLEVSVTIGTVATQPGQGQ
jgi:hypothetical protein